MRNETPSDFIDKIDIDKNNAISSGELDVLAARLFPLPITETNRTLFAELLSNCSSTYIRGDTFSPHDLLTCGKLNDTIAASISSLPRYPHVIVDDHHVTFKMLKSNTSKIRIDLDYIRYKPKKFICLNDNMDHLSESYQDNFRILQDFYKTMYPLPSPFEHPPGTANAFLYKSDYLNKTGFSFTYILLWSSIIIILFILLFKRSFFRNSRNLIMRLFY